MWSIWVRNSPFELMKKTGTALEVFDGRVRFADKRDKSSVHLLEVGQRMRFTARRFFQEQPQGRPCFAELLTSVHELERAVIAEHPLAYWRFENVGESPIVPDASGNGHHGLKKNGVSVSPIDGIAGGALKLDGVDDYVEVPDSPELSLQDRSLTVLGWINVRDVTQEHPLVATGLNEDGKSPHTWSVSLDESGNFEAGVNLEAGRTTVADASDADLRDGTWRQIAFVLDREKGEQRYYVDGRLVSTTPIDSVLEGTPIRCEDSLRIGMDAESDCTEGYIDEVAVFPRVLSDEKIAELYDAAKK